MTPQAFSRNLRDAQNIYSITLPAAASTSTTSSTVDVAGPSGGVPPETIELLLEVPALNTTIVPDTKTVTYIIEASTASDMSSPVTLFTLTQTGAGGAGVGAVAQRVRVPAGLRYAHGKVTFGANTTDGSAVTGAALSILF